MQRNCIKYNMLKTKINKLLDEGSGRFFNQLIYWSTCRGDYGIYKNGKVWIYNTLDDWAEQLKTSKSSVRRVIKSLKEKNLITSEYLSKNKRNRTLYYAVDFDELNAYISKESCVQKLDAFEHINEHMYININKQINKSYKSEKIIDKNFQQSGLANVTLDPIIFVDSVSTPQVQSAYPEAGSKAINARGAITTVQDIAKIWTRLFPKSPLLLTKELSRYLVAAFKRKFNSSLKEWEKYLKLIKTSAYVMKDSFKQFIDWVINFKNIDKFRAGWLGVSESSIPVEEREIEEKAMQHIDAVKESGKCKEIRRKIVSIISVEHYNLWFKYIELVENNGSVFMKEVDGVGGFAQEYISENLSSKIGLEFVNEDKNKRSPNNVVMAA